MMLTARQSLKILFVVHAFPPLSYAGTELYTYYIAKMMRSRGHDVSVFHPMLKTTGRDYEILESTYEGLRMARVNVVVQDDPISSIKNDELARVFEHYITDRGFDLVHFQHLAHLSDNLLEIPQKVGIRSLLTLHDFWFLCNNIHLLKDRKEPCTGPETVDKCVSCIIKSNGYHRDGLSIEDKANLFFSLAYRSEYHKQLVMIPDMLIAPSLYARQVLETHGIPKGRIQVLPIGIAPVRMPVPEGRAANGREIHSVSKGEVVFGYLGNICRQKGLHILLKAFRGFSGPARLNIYGKIEDEKYFKAMQPLIDEDCRISYRGRYGPDDLPLILSSVEATIVPSLSENYPLIVRESLSARVPVIASRVGAIPEIIRDGKTGLLFEMGNAEALREKLELFVSDRGLADRMKQEIEMPVTIEEDAEALEKKYFELLAVRC